SSSKTEVSTDYQASMQRFLNVDPDMKRFFDTSYGYAIFPQITKGGLIVGGAHGDGAVFEQGRRIGNAEVTQATFGAQIGGQSFSEVIFFQDKASLDHFKQNNLELSADTSAVAASKGASASADYKNGASVFTLGEGGLMLQAAVGGQKFKFHPMASG